MAKIPYFRFSALSIVLGMYAAPNHKYLNLPRVAVLSGAQVLLFGRTVGSSQERLSHTQYKQCCIVSIDTAIIDF